MQDSSDEGETEVEDHQKVDLLVPACPPAPPLPPPPPPPPPAVAQSRQGDGISHMTMLAKSKMHEELVSKAKSRQQQQQHSEESTTMVETTSEQTVTEVSRTLVSSHVSQIEHKLEMNGTNGHPAVPSTAEDATDQADKNSPKESLLPESEASRQKPMQKTKLYDSIFADRRLPEKELKRRQFLFGYPATQPKPAPKEEAKPLVEEPKQKQEEKKEPEKSADPKPITKPEPASPQQPNGKDAKDGKKKKKCCCTVL